MKRILYMAYILAALALFAPLRAQAEPKAEKDLTLMIYMCGSNLESQYACGFADIEEIRESGVDTGAVDVLLLTGGSRYWHTGQDADTIEIQSLRYSKRAQQNLWGSEQTLPATSLGQADTLLDFLNYGVENHPARSYALILWDHGGGPMEGLCWDENFDPDRLSVDELTDALARSPFGPDNPLEWIGFDACLMSSAETAGACAPYARYMIASQETEPGTGWNYDFLSGVSGNLDGEAVGQLIVDRYSAVSNADQLMMTLSCVDLGKVSAVEAAIDGLFAELDALLGPEGFSKLSNGRRDAKGFGRASTGSEYDLVDLYSLSEQYADLAPEKTSDLQGALEDAVLATGGNQAGSHGLSIYYPYYNKSHFQSQWQAQLDRQVLAPGYREFMDRYADVWLGEQMADWSGMKAEAQAPQAQAQEITLPLTDEQAANFAYAQLYILGTISGSNDFYYKTDEIDDVVLDDAGVLHAEYNYRALYTVDENGMPMAGPITYRIVDGYYLIRASLSDMTWDEYWAAVTAPRDGTMDTDVAMKDRKVYLQCLPNAAGDGLDVVGVIDLGAELGDRGLVAEADDLISGKQAIDPDLAGWPWVWFFHFPRVPVTGADGNPLPFDAWRDPNDQDTMAWEHMLVDNARPWSLKFLEYQSTGNNLYAQYIVWDTQGNPTGSNLLSITNPNLARVADLDEVLYDSDGFKLTATGVDLSTSDSDAGLLVRFTLEGGPTDADNLLVYIRDVTLNRCAIVNDYWASAFPDGQGRRVYTLRVPADGLPDALETDIRRLGFTVQVYNDSYETLAEFPVTLEQAIDLSPIHTQVPEPAALAEAIRKGVDFRLLGLAQDEECVTLSLVADNPGDERVFPDIPQDAFVNGCEWASAAEAPGLFEVPADSWRPLEIKLYKTSLETDSIRNPVGLPQFSFPEYWGIDAIETVEFPGSFDCEPTVLALPEPFPLEGTATAAVEPALSLPLAASDEITITVTWFKALEDGLHLVLDVENRGDQRILLDADSASVNGETAEAEILALNSLTSFSSTVELGPGQRARVRCMVEVSDGEAPIADFDLGFSFRAYEGFYAELNADPGDRWHDRPEWRVTPAAFALAGSPTLNDLMDDPAPTEALSLVASGAVEPLEES